MLNLCRQLQLRPALSQLVSQSASQHRVRLPHGYCVNFPQQQVESGLKKGRGEAEGQHWDEVSYES